MYFHEERKQPWYELHFEAPVCSPLERRDYFSCIGLFLWCLLLNLPGLGALEFFRHTEADRTLIAWEMFERRDFLIPHLLGSEILTKPPIFYWMVALAISLFGEPSEWVARLPSVLAASLLVAMQFVFIRKSGGSFGLGLLGALALSTGILFLNLGSSAEIDMVYGLFSTLTLTLLYFGLAYARPGMLISAYAIAALAFLTKGPPILAFFATALLVFSAWRTARDVAPPAFFSFWRWISWNVFGSMLFVVISGTWVYLVAQRVGGEALLEQFRVEILDRFFDPSHRGRGFFYYFLKLPVNLMPWAPFILLGLLAPLHPRSARSYSDYRSQTNLWRFFLFHIVVVFGSIFILSLAEGKSTRYMFPVYPFAMNGLALAFLFLKETEIPATLFKLGKWIGGGICAVAIIVPVLHAACTDPFIFAYVPSELPKGLLKFRESLRNISLSGLILVCMLVAISSAIVAGAAAKKSAVWAISGLVLLASVWRLAERTIYAPYRNETRSVGALARSIDRLVPDDASLYTVEMFERWVVYYLKRDGRRLARLTPTIVRNFEGLPEERVFLLLSTDEETWRLEQLRVVDPTTQITASFHEGLNRLLLVETSSKALRSLHVHRMIPTVPSKPYYHLAPKYREDFESGIDLQVPAGS